MSLFAELTPSPIRPTVDWSRISSTFHWFQALAGCPQDPVFHAEGDVAIHTRLVVEALLMLPDWQRLSPDDREDLFWAALLHDVAKPATTRTDEAGRVTARGHSRRGQIMARAILWRLNMPWPRRERVCHLVTHHQVPLYALEREAPQAIAYRISYQTRCDLLSVLAEADVRGRVCPDAARLLDNIALFRELAREAECLDRPRNFASDHSRFLYFRQPGRDPTYAAHDDCRNEATLLSGLPAAGKDTWLARHCSHAEIISLDTLRAELRIAPEDSQGKVVAAARERAKVALRSGRPLIWNGTNLSRDRRRALVDLFADYGARVRMVYLETTAEEARRRNAVRTRPVPDRAFSRMLHHWEPPDLTECHELCVALS